MSPVLAPVIVALALAAAACSIGNVDRQWYKPSGEYTSAEFERDRRTCTRDRQLDEACLRRLGWTSLSSDADPVRPAEAPQMTPPRTRY